MKELYELHLPKSNKVQLWLLLADAYYQAEIGGRKGKCIEDQLDIVSLIEKEIEKRRKSKIT